MAGCNGKYKWKPTARVGAVTEARGNNKSSSYYTPLDDPSCPCCFMGRDGLPCRRPAVSNNACTRHARDAQFMCMMVNTTPITDATPTQEALVEKGRVDNAVEQTTQEVDTNKGLCHTIQEMEYAWHCEAMRITRLEIKIENEREELNMERVLLQSTSEEDKRTITTLQEEVSRLRVENVTLKRREESLKGKYMASHKMHVRVTSK